MTRPRLLTPCGRAAALSLCALIGLGLLGRSLPPLILINESPSLPRGLYVRVGDNRPQLEDTVAVPQPRSARPYLDGIGMPPGVLLLKRVAAGEGDPVCRDGHRLHVAGRSLSVAAQDRAGVALPEWQACRRLAPGEIFLLGDTTSSFDSRYFGPVQIEDITGTYRELLAW